MTPSTPPGKVPRWLRFLFPSATAGLEDNPLFIRLSGEGFCRNRRWFQRDAPSELRESKSSTKTRDIVITGFVLLLFFGWIACMFADLFIGIKLKALQAAPSGSNGTLIAILNVMRLGIHSMLPLALVPGLLGLLSMISVYPLLAFIENASLGGWGDDLCLTPLKPEDYDRAVFAAITMNTLWTVIQIVFVIPLVLSCLAVFTYYTKSSGNLATRGELFLVLIRCTSLWFPMLIGAIETCAICALGLATAFPLLAYSAGNRSWQSTRAAAGALFLAAAAQIPAFLAADAWRQYRPSYNPGFPAADLRMVVEIVCIFTLISLPLSHAATRYLLRRHCGSFGAAFFERVREARKK